MSLGTKASDLNQSPFRPKSVEEAVGSHFALQVALQTMKERCQHLQQRLAAVEEENVRLRIENRRRKSDSACTVAADAFTNESEDSKTRIDGLEEKVAMLTRQKSQLTHHLFMVATENRQLWNRLSRLTQANQSLGSHLSKISSTLSRHHSTNSITIPKSESPISSLSHRDELNLSSNSVLTEDSDNIAKKGTDTEYDGVKEHSNLFARTSHGKCGFNCMCYGTPLIPHIHTLGILCMFTPVPFISKTICQKNLYPQRRIPILCVIFRGISCHIQSELCNPCVGNGTVSTATDMRL